MPLSVGCLYRSVAFIGRLPFSVGCLSRLVAFIGRLPFSVGCLSRSVAFLGGLPFSVGCLSRSVAFLGGSPFSVGCLSRCPLKSAGEESCDIRDRCVRFGERFSYCDPQIPASAGVRPCVCFSVSLVEFSGRLLLVVLGSLWNWRMAVLVECGYGFFGGLSVE